MRRMSLDHMDENWITVGMRSRRSWNGEVYYMERVKKENNDLLHTGTIYIAGDG